MKKNILIFLKNKITNIHRTFLSASVLLFCAVFFFLGCLSERNSKSLQTGVIEKNLADGKILIESTAAASKISIQSQRRTGMTAASCDAAKLMLNGYLQDKKYSTTGLRIIENVIIENGKYCRIRAQYIPSK